VLPDGATRAKTFPLSRYLRAFDVVVAASGYNLFHEAFAYGVPTIFAPKPSSRLDDQPARARWAAERDVGWWWAPPDPDGLAAILDQACDPHAREAMAQRIAEAREPNGAAEAARIIASIAGV